MAFKEQLGELYYKITGDDAKLKKSIGDSEKGAKGLQNTFKNLGAAIGGAFLAKQALSFGASLVRLADVQIKSEKKLEQTLKSTRNAVGLSVDELKKMASGLQDVTTFGDETILGAQSLLLTFTKIGKDVFPAATETVLNMSVAFGQDLKSSAVQLGKALNDPIQGVTALRRVGVQLTEEQENQIKTYTELGDIQKAQTIILKELETQVGGQARAAVEGAGSVEQLKNILGDLGEELGREIIPLITDVVSTVAPMVKSFTIMDSTTKKVVLTLTTVTPVLIGITAALPALTAGFIALQATLLGPAGIVIGLAALIPVLVVYGKGQEQRIKNANAERVANLELADSYKELTNKTEDLIDVANDLKEFSQSPVEVVGANSINLLKELETQLSETDKQLNDLQKANDGAEASQKGLNNQIKITSSDLQLSVAQTKGYITEEQRLEKANKQSESTIKKLKTQRDELLKSINNIKNAIKEETVETKENNIAKNDELTILEETEIKLVDRATQLYALGESQNFAAEGAGILRSAIEEASLEFGAGSKQVEQLKSRLGTFVDSANDAKDEAGAGGIIDSLLGSVDSGSLNDLVSSVYDLSEAIGETAAGTSEISGGDWVSLIISAVKGIGKAFQEIGEDAETSGGKFVGKIGDGIESLFTMKSAIQALSGPFIGLVKGKEFEKANAKLMASIMEDYEETYEAIEQLVKDTQLQIQEFQLDQLEEYASERIRILTGLSAVEDKIADKALADEEKRYQDEILDLKDQLLQETDLKKKAEIQQSIDSIETDRELQLEKIRLEEITAGILEDIEKSIALARLSIKKEQVTADFTVREAELKADYASAIAAAEGIRGKSERETAKAKIFSAYSEAFSTLGSAENLAREAVDLEAQATLGNTEAVLSSFDGVQAYTTESGEELTVGGDGTQLIENVIYLDGEVISDSVSESSKNNNTVIYNNAVVSQ